MLSATTRALAVTGVAAGVLALGVSSASAASTYTVKAGSAKTGATVAVTGATTGSTPQMTFGDVTSGVTFTCNSGTIAGSTKVGSGKAAAGLATITGSKATFTTCVGPVGLQFTVKGTGTWRLNATKYAGGVTTGTLTGVNASVQTSDPSQCSFTVAGTVPGTYTNSTQTLAATGGSSLTIKTVTGCFGALNVGDKASYKASYKLKATVAADNPIAITSP